VSAQSFRRRRTASPASRRRRAIAWGERARAAGHPVHQGDDLPELRGAHVSGTEVRVGGGERGLEHERRRGGVDGQVVFPVAHPELAVSQRHTELFPLEHPGPEIAQDRQQHAGVEAGLAHPPLDVEPARIGRAGPVRQHVLPAPVLDRGRHVIGHDVEHQTHPPLVQGGHQTLERRLVAQLGVQDAGIHDVVAVLAAGTGPENGRAVDVGDAEAVEVGDEIAGAGQRKAAVELEPVGREDPG
jgi:hypothetical protein